MGGGKIEALVSGFTEFAIWELKQVFWRHFKTRKWRDDLMKISFGGRPVRWIGGIIPPNPGKRGMGAGGCVHSVLKKQRVVQKDKANLTTFRGGCGRNERGHHSREKS